VIFFCFREVGWKVVDTLDTHISGQDGNTGFFLCDIPLIRLC
jgi:hypothetical protein